MATDFDTARNQYELYRYCYDNGHDAWIKSARRCFDFWSGKQWDPAVKARLEREGRPALTFNVIESLVRSMKGVQRALRNDVRFAAVYDADAESSRVRDAIWLNVQNQNSLEFLETEIYEKGLIMGRAYYDVRVSYDESLYGDIKVRGLRSQDVILDPSVDTYDPADGWPRVMTRRWVSSQDIANLFGRDKAEAVGYNTMPGWYDYEDQFMAQQMGRMPYYHTEVLSDVSAVRGHLLIDHQHMIVKNKEMFVDMKTGDCSEIPETWDRERIGKVLSMSPGVNTMKRKVKTVRWDVTCESVVLHSEDSPYKNFTVVPFFPSFLDGVSGGAVESLLDPAELFNKITSQELHIINTTANSGWKVKRGSLKNMSIEELEQVGARSGFVAELDDISQMEKIQPNTTPQGHDRLSFKADQIMRSMSGVSDSARGFARDDASSGKVLQDQAGQEINFAGWLSNLHRSKQILATRVVDCAASHYTETRVIQINRGTALVPNIETLTLNEPTAEGAVLNDITRGKYSTVLVPAPSRTTMSGDDFRLLMEMRELGIAIPDNMLIELSPASNKAQIIQALSGDSNERQRAAEEAEAQAAAIEQQKNLATAKKEEAAALLNQARADKAAVEAASDPDAPYERVEQARIEAERRNNDSKNEIARATLAETIRNNRQQAALTLVKLDVDRESADADRVAAKQDNRPAARREKKPGAKKSA